MGTQEALVRVHQEWHSWRSAEVRLRDLREVHWYQPFGAPHPLLHAFISCADIVTGDIPHACERGPGCHRLLVCILKRHTVSSVYTALGGRADQLRALTAPEPRFLGQQTA